MTPLSLPQRWCAAAMLMLLASAALAQSAPPVRLPPGVTKVTAVEGITEYRLANGLRVVLFPDASQAKATVNITYLVGSRQENYGETGMAHLLEHLIFKGSKNFPKPEVEFNRRGFQNNASTWFDRTNYFSTFQASDDNMRWALQWSADAMINSFIARKDLDSEMTVVRNEFEMGENDPNRVMFQRVQSLLYDWHNYGKSTIGARSDIENVRIENLQSFYRRYYQPDNAVLTVAGRFDEGRVLEWIAQDFGRIPKPTRTLPPEWTVEPTHDGERSFAVRRKGETQMVVVAYRLPAGVALDYDAASFAADIMSDTPSGRLYKALVEPGLAAQVFGYTIATRHPGFAMFGAVVKKGEPVEPVKAKMIEVIEGTFRQAPVTQEELARMVEQSRTQFERTLADPAAFGVGLSEFIALGDWRLFFLSRDALDRITPAQVDAAAARYFVRDNRVVGTFIPEDAPQRAEIAMAPSAAERLAAFKPAAAAQAGEVFEPTQANIDKRTRILDAGPLRIALLPKKNRGEKVSVVTVFQWGDVANLSGRSTDASLASAMLMRGTTQMTRQQIDDEMTRLKMTGGLSSFETTRANLPAALKLVFQVMKDASFPASEFTLLKGQTVTALQSQLDSPEARSADVLSTHFNTYPPGDPRYYMPLAQRIEAIGKAEIDPVRAFHRGFYGTARGQVAVVGDFDEAAVAALVKDTFPSFVSPAAWGRVEREFREVPPKRFVIDTPDKENAYLRARQDLALKDTDPDAPALQLANWIFGGGAGLSNRLMDRLRQKDGLSYGAWSQLSLGSRTAYSVWSAEALVNPANAKRAEQAVREELERVRRDGFSDREVADARKGLLDARALARTQDAALARGWATNLDLDRTYAFSQQFEDRLRKLTTADVTAAFRKHLDPAKMSFAIAGDLKKAPGLQP